MTEGLERLREWVGRVEERSDRVDAERLAMLSATLDRDDPPPAAGDPLPPAWHWMFFREAARQSTLDADGHTARGGFLPPVPLPRRMRAGGRLAFHAAPVVGAEMTRRSEVLSVTPKAGKTGRLVFVVVRHRITTEGRLAIEEEQDLVYREAPKPGDPRPAPKPAPPAADWRRTVTPDPVLLFRYSALTFNGHRIHYDLPHSAAEGYPGLVVHGPLLATLLLDLCRRARPDDTIDAFRFRAVAPLFAPDPITLAGRAAGDGAEIALWAADAAGGVAMQADARLSP